ncbi:hypothetical protein CFIMG_008622RA00001 [Ceratocystis fimbriata CBS 114723]|uniref:Uncharacterized protein n=1 Tax=Ceratocystis fimbriata CBS 114723 TaxID=1035309 RepID=A0A2C5X858_9PEZI|nr:hypothetical protein CFIMG_008622RA00001 [Ceratocystis fimbriata CBS 114723]
MHPRSIALIFALTGNAIAAAIGNDVESAKTDSKLIARDPDPRCYWLRMCCYCEFIPGEPTIYDDENCEGPPHM